RPGTRCTCCQPDRRKPLSSMTVSSKRLMRVMLTWLEPGCANTLNLAKRPSAGIWLNIAEPLPERHKWRERVRNYEMEQTRHTDHTGHRNRSRAVPTQH